MNRQQRRRAKARSLSHHDLVRAFINTTVLHNAPAVPTVGVGPIVWGINPTDGRHWYFVCASADADHAFHLDCFKIGHDDQHLAAETRTILLQELIQPGSPIVIHEFDDERAFTAFCAAAWPSERTQRLHDAVNADYFSRPDL